MLKQTQVNVWQQIGAQEPSAAAASLMKKNDNFGYKSRTQMLEVRVAVCGVTV